MPTFLKCYVGRTKKSSQERDFAEGFGCAVEAALGVQSLQLDSREKERK